MGETLGGGDLGKDGWVGMGTGGGISKFSEKSREQEERGKGGGGSQAGVIGNQVEWDKGGQGN